MERLLRPVMSSTSSRPAATASSTTYWMAGLSTTGSISLGVALVAGRNLVPRPAAGITALVTSAMSRTLVHLSGYPGKCQSRSLCSPARLRALDPPPSLVASLLSPGGGAPFGSRYCGDVQGVQQEKGVLRTRLRAARSALTPDERRDAGRLIRDTLLDLPSLQMAGTVAAYYSVGTEP